ncbi:hypothetical protein L207DRAFT_107053 [Hyaloscypha variabilis F]|uniref:Uncharacterized protein n=1 Tax=Hyaloscypha variabilis (strain UAMH 11265 / GT02V1 / F) TaxID=1149755 RepID=A0A2J6RD23_HYAVF|nr:hypothetical protein L207DRAFT_107053 [Hyaloscypha variabilis F]
MKYVTELVSVILVALLANTANAAPNYPGPSTSSVVDFTLYKTPAPNQNQCYDSVDFVNVASSDLVYTGDGAGSTVCNPGDFYVAQIDSVAWDWTCQLNVYSDTDCTTFVASIVQSNDWYPCEFPGGSLIDLHSWKVFCE